jgi:uncharacterized protein (UPF0179 family)
MNKYHFNRRYDVKVQKQRCHLMESNMSTVAILVPSLVFFLSVRAVLHFSSFSCSSPACSPPDFREAV